MAAVARGLSAIRALRIRYRSIVIIIVVIVVDGKLPGGAGENIRLVGAGRRRFRRAKR